MIQPNTFFTDLDQLSRESFFQSENQVPCSALSPELLRTFTVLLNSQSNFWGIAWRKAIVPPPPVISEIEHQKMAFIQKLVEVVRKSSTAKSSTCRAEDGQDAERSAKITPNSSN